MQETAALDCLKHFSKLRVIQTKTKFSATDIRHLLSGYCVFDSNRVRYRVIKKKDKLAIIGVVCSIREKSIVLSSLTKHKLSVFTSSASDFKMGEALVLLNPKLKSSDKQWILEISEESETIVLGKAVDFGFCCYEDKSKRCEEVINKSTGNMCEKHSKTEFEFLSRTIARRQELGGASIYNELRFKHNSRNNRSGTTDNDGSGVGKSLRKRQQQPFYDVPGFEQEVDAMPEGKEKAHLEALLKRLKPKQIKTMQEQMQDHLMKKQVCTLTQTDGTDKDNESHSELHHTHLTPQKQPKKECDYVLLESVEPRPTAVEIENLIFSLKKATHDFSPVEEQSDCEVAESRDHEQKESHGLETSPAAQTERRSSETNSLLILEKQNDINCCQ